MNLTTMMISCKQRREEREHTLSQIPIGVVMGITILEMECEPPSLEMNRWGAYRAAKQAHKNYSGLLFLEDDLDFADSFETFLRMAVSHNLLTTFCVIRNSLYPEGFERGAKFSAAKDPRGMLGRLVKLNTPRVQLRRGFHGSQALYLPMHVVDELVKDQEEFVREDEEPLPHVDDGFDFWIKDNAHLWGIYAAYPNPVQHRNPPSMFGGKGVHKSDSYGMKTYFEGDLE